MRLKRPTSKFLILTAVALVAGSGAVALGYSECFSDARLGADWHCERTAFIVTTCTPVKDVYGQQRPAVSETIATESR